MQSVGYIEIDGKMVNVLFRQKKYSRCLKLRKGGENGTHLVDEEQFLLENKEMLEMLLDGKTIDI